MKLAVGDKVRVHYYPADAKPSFVEGVVRQVDIPTSRGPAFVIDVTCEVVFDREQPIKRRQQTYVLYERRDKFPGRIEVLSRAEAEPASTFEPELEHEPAQEDVETEPTTEQVAWFGADEGLAFNSEDALEHEPSSKDAQADVEPAAEHDGSETEREPKPRSNTDTEVMRNDASAPRPTPDTDQIDSDVERQGTARKTGLIAALFRKDR